MLHVTVGTLPPARQIMRAPVNNMFIIDTGLCWTQRTLDTRSQLVEAVLVTTAVVAASAGWRPLIPAVCSGQLMASPQPQLPASAQILTSTQHNT